MYQAFKLHLRFSFEILLVYKASMVIHVWIWFANSTVGKSILSIWMARADLSLIDFWIDFEFGYIQKLFCLGRSGIMTQSHIEY